MLKLDEELFNDLLRNYQSNINNFKTQNSGFIVDNITPLHENDVIKFVANVLHMDDGVIDRELIDKSFSAFAIHPTIENINKQFGVHVDLIPDIVCCK